MDAVTERAVAAIGADHPETDWILDPDAHARALATRAGAEPLVRILQRDEIRAIVSRFRDGDRAAVRRQGSYKLLGRLEIALTLAATVVGATALLPFVGPLIAGGPGAQPASAAASGLLVLVQYALILLSFLAAALLRHGRHMEAWQKARGAAERARVAYFDAVMAADEPARDGEIPALALKLEYFRRHQLGMQAAYYAGRGAQHARGATRWRLWRLVSVAIYAAVFLIGAPSAIALLHEAQLLRADAFMAWIRQFAWFGDISARADESLLAVGVITSAMQSAMRAVARMDMDERNAARYLLTADNLKYLGDTGLEPARRSAAAGEAEPVLRFVAEVQDQISSEHQEWILLRPNV